MARILILGAGAVGQLIGGLLAKAGRNQVTLVGRPDHYNAIRMQGLTIKAADSTEVIRNLNFLPIITRISPSEKFDWVFMTVKSFDLINSLRDLKPIVENNRNIRFLLFQRGVGSHEELEGIIPQDRLFMAALTANVAIIEPGTILQTNESGGLCLAPLKPLTDMKDLLAIFAGFSIPVFEFDDWRKMKWSALLYEMLTNGLCALSDFTPEKLLGKKPLFKLEIEAFREGIAVLGKLGLEIVNLPGYDLKKMIFLSKLPDFIKYPLIKSEIGNSLKTRVPTIKIDMEKAKNRSEVEYINGAISRWGKERGVNTPVNDFINEELMRIVSGKRSWEDYRKKTDSVIAYYRLFRNNVYKSR